MDQGETTARVQTAQSEFHDGAPPDVLTAQSARSASDQSNPPAFTMPLEIEIRFLCDERLDAANHLGERPTARGVVGRVAAGLACAILCVRLRRKFVPMTKQNSGNVCPGEVEP